MWQGDRIARIARVYITKVYGADMFLALGYIIRLSPSFLTSDIKAGRSPSTMLRINKPGFFIFSAVKMFFCALSGLEIYLYNEHWLVILD